MAFPYKNTTNPNLQKSDTVNFIQSHMPVIRYNFKKLTEQAKVTVLILDPKVPMFPILGIVIFHKIPKQSVLLITSVS